MLLEFSFVCRYPGKGLADISYSMALNAPIEATIYGTKGTVKVDLSRCRNTSIKEGTFTNQKHCQGRSCLSDYFHPTRFF